MIDPAGSALSKVDKDEEITFLKNQRNGIKGRVTYFKNLAEKRTGTLDELQSYYNRLRTTYAKFDEIQTKLERYDSTEFFSGQRDQFDKDYGAVETLLLSLISEQKTSSNGFQNISGTSNNITNSSQVLIRLPDVEIPKFSGNFMHWLRFRDIYRDLIHNNTALTNTTKLHYLYSCVKDGSAAQYIDTLPFSGDKYEAAWKLLTDHYDNEPRLQREYVKQIYDIKKVQENSSSSLQEFIDTFYKLYNGLEALSQPVKEWDLLLIHHLSTKLDDATRHEVEVKTDQTRLLSLKEFMDILSQRARVLQALNKGNNRTQSSKS